MLNTGRGAQDQHSWAPFIESLEHIFIPSIATISEETQNAGTGCEHRLMFISSIYTSKLETIQCPQGI